MVCFYTDIYISHDPNLLTFLSRFKDVWTDIFYHLFRLNRRHWKTLIHKICHQLIQNSFLLLKHKIVAMLVFQETPKFKGPTTHLIHLLEALMVTHFISDVMFCTGKLVMVLNLFFVDFLFQGHQFKDGKSVSLPINNLVTNRRKNWRDMISICCQFVFLFILVLKATRLPHSLLQMGELQGYHVRLLHDVLKNFIIQENGHRWRLSKPTNQSTWWEVSFSSHNPHLLAFKVFHYVVALT